MKSPSILLLLVDNNSSCVESLFCSGLAWYQSPLAHKSRTTLQGGSHAATPGCIHCGLYSPCKTDEAPWGALPRARLHSQGLYCGVPTVSNLFDHFFGQHLNERMVLSVPRRLTKVC